MSELTFEEIKEIENLKHNHKLEEIKLERQAHIDVAQLKFENDKSMHRLKRADIRRTIEEKHQRF